MEIKIKATAIDLTDAIRQYVDERMESIAKLVDEYDAAAMVEVEVGKSTQHHNNGPFMLAEINLTFLGNLFRAAEEREDLYEAIDVCKDEVRRQLVAHKEKTQDEQRVPRPDKE